MEDLVRVTDLKDHLVSLLRRGGYLRTPGVETAFRRVPRHLFTPPGISPQEAYRDEVVQLIPGLATVSQPSIVALMLEELRVEPGMRVLELGTASGYNAALLAELAGDPGLIYTVEIEPRLAALARGALERAGYGGVHVRAGDGSFGFPEGAPFDRVVVTFAANDLAAPLVAQIKAGGWYLAPFAVPALPALLLCLEKQGEETLAGSFVGIPVTFVPMRGEYGAAEEAGGQAERRVRQAVRAAHDRAWLAGEHLQIGESMTVGLVAAALAESQPELDPEELAVEAWERVTGAGLPDLTALRVAVGPHGQTGGELVLNRRDYSFVVALSAGED